MSTSLAKTYFGSMVELADEYLLETGKMEATTDELAMWAISTGRWDAPPDLVRKKCKEDFAKALREDYIKDEEGLSVRAKHAARRRVGDTQMYFWADIRNTTRAHIANAYSLRREQIVGDCRQLDRDKDYWNSRHPDEEPIRLTFDFTDDVEEGKYSVEYPPKIDE